MAIGEKITEIRKSKNISIDTLSKLSGVPVSTLKKISAGITKDPQIETIKSIASALNCTLEDFSEQHSVYTLQEKNLICDYRKLDSYGKDAVDVVLQSELKRIKEQTIINTTTFNNIKHYSAILYDFPVSAGTGERPDATNASIVEIEEEPPRGTDYILRIAGNSMEPEYGDGDYVYVESTTTLNFGDVGIFAYEGSTYMKLYTESGLKSLNPNYALIQGEDIHILGKVLGVVEGNIK